MAIAESFTATEQVNWVPEQTPLHPLNTPPPGFAVRTTVDPAATGVVQLPPQLILPFAPVTVPLPTLVTVIDGTPTLAAAICAPI